MSTIFDIGMFDGLDTDYYLECGYRVVAVEANPELVARARRERAAEVATGRLVVVHAAMAANHEPVSLYLSGTDLGSSSVHPELVERKQPAGVVSVRGLTLADLLGEHGVPRFMKVDIEGEDRVCVLALSAGAVPDYLSFEIGPDFQELLDHARAVGYRRFKIVNQMSYRELANHECLQDRLARRVSRLLGRPKPSHVRRSGRRFACGYCSGPLPWRSDGAWRTYEQTVAGWKAAQGGLANSGWYDLLATTT
jgi:FkbM family methyltransferase